MAMDSRKRPSPAGEAEDLRTSKRQRTATRRTVESTKQHSAAEDAQVPSKDEQARDELRRSLVLALQHVGFDSASEEALESFTVATETYMQSFLEDVSRRARASRRAQPTPPDFDAALARFNLSTPALKPHRKNPVAGAKLRPQYFDPMDQHPSVSRPLPLIGDELSGRPEKESKLFIPKGFPAFPSIHTYRYTPEDADTATVRGIGLKYDDGAAVGGQSQSLPEGPRGDPKKIREAAAREAKQAEEALRGLVRASKINDLKEVRAAAERNPLSKERYGLWETAMRGLIDDDGTFKGKGIVGAAGAGRVEIADRSMMVNAQKAFHLRELQRAGKKGAQK